MGCVRTELAYLLISLISGTDYTENTDLIKGNRESRVIRA
ncbi:hypothetical protein HMPREF9445_02303 [Bacteroides clarus YIT 12056]|uniref:Uncharacterized protein n=1 Tax=Bacteroides clarus YIT 12056 TaxID=762984 RepID=A0ABN0CLV8_9BACE|nr:hypothetical protein HMPREF9445_02303 [Bacteroides clarus YIT 12056]